MTHLQTMVLAALKRAPLGASVRQIMELVGSVTEEPTASNVRTVLCRLLEKGKVSRRCGDPPVWKLIRDERP